MLSTTAPRTRVVHVRKEAFDVYIGRAMPGFPASKFANLAKINASCTRTQALAWYHDWVIDQPDLMRELESLRGKTLGCWCKPHACHGDILAELLDGPAPAPAQSDLF